MPGPSLGINLGCGKHPHRRWSHNWSYSQPLPLCLAKLVLQSLVCVKIKVVDLQVYGPYILFSGQALLCRERVFLSLAPRMRLFMNCRAHKEKECAASECSLLCNDYLRLGYSNMIVDPGVRQAYSIKDAVDLYNSDWVRITSYLKFGATCSALEQNTCSHSTDLGGLQRSGKRDLSSQSLSGLHTLVICCAKMPTKQASIALMSRKL